MLETLTSACLEMYGLGQPARHMATVTERWRRCERWDSYVTACSRRGAPPPPPSPPAAAAAAEVKPSSELLHHCWARFRFTANIGLLGSCIAEHF